MRRAARTGGLAVVAIAIVALTSCTSSSKSPPPSGNATARPGASSTAPAPKPGRSFTLAEPGVAAFNTPPLLPVEAKTGVQTVLNEYLERAVLTPLASGRAGDLAPLFTASALERVNGPDRPALVDEGVVNATDIALGRATAKLTALVGPEGVHLIVAGISLVVTGKVNGTPMVIQRSGELTLLVDGDTWKISSYDVRVDRDVPQ